MKLILALVLFISTIAVGQTEDSTKYIWYKFQYGSRMPRFWSDTANHIPYGDTALFAKPQSPGFIMMHTDKNVYRWDSTGWRSMGGGSSNTSSEGIRKNTSNFELGDVAGQNNTTLSVDRYLRGGNKSIYFQGNKTTLGNANIIFDDSLTATAGDPKFKTWMQINSLNHVSAPFYFGTANVEDGSGFVNHVMNWGFNLSPASTRVDPTYCATGSSWEGNFQGLMEMHYFFIDKQDIQHRLQSFTIDTAAKTVDLFHQITSWELKDVDQNAEVWVDFTGGNGGTSTNFRMYAGTTNQYKLQNGFSVNGGNTTASISSDGPGQREFHIDDGAGWGTVFLPTMFSNSTYNQFSTQIQPATDGNLDIGSPTGRFKNIDGMYHRAATGMRIGDFSGNELPNTSFDIVAPGSANGNIHIQSTTNSNAGITVENANSGNSILVLKAKTGSGVVPLIGLTDQDDASNSASIALERNSSQLLNGAVNDMIIRNLSNNKAILFGNTVSSTTAERMRINSNGELQVGSTTDLGSSKLQVTGTIQMQDGNQGSGKVLTSDADGVGTWQSRHPYLVYIATISQTGTSAPTVTILENTLGSITWARSTTGVYTGTLSSAFATNYTWCSATNSDESGSISVVKLRRTNDNAVTLQILDNTFTNMDAFTNVSIEIRAYPAP